MANIVTQPRAERILPRVRGLHIIQGILVAKTEITEGTGDQAKVWLMRVWALGEGEFDGIATGADGTPLLYIRTRTGGIMKLADVERESPGTVQWRFHAGRIGQPPDPMWDVNLGGVGYSGTAYLLVKIQVQGPGTNGRFERGRGDESLIDTVFGIYRGKRVSRIYNEAGEVIARQVYTLNPVDIFIDDMTDPMAMGVPLDLLDLPSLIRQKPYWDETIAYDRGDAYRQLVFYYTSPWNRVDPLVPDPVDNLDLYFAPNPATQDEKSGYIADYFSITITYTDNTTSVVSVPLPSGVTLRVNQSPNPHYTVPPPDADLNPPIRARYIGQQADYADRGASDPPRPDGFADIHIRLSGLPRKPIAKINITAAGGADGIWESPGNGTHWTIKVSAWPGTVTQTQPIPRAQCQLAYTEALSPTDYFDYQSLHSMFDIVNQDGQITIWPADRRPNPYGPDPPVIKRYDPNSSPAVGPVHILTDGSDGRPPNIKGEEWVWRTKDERELVNELIGNFRNTEDPEFKLLSAETVVATREELRQKTGTRIVNQLALGNMNASQARRVVELQIRRRTDLRKTLTGWVGRDAWHVMPHDVVLVTLKAAGYVEQPFLVIERVEDPETGGATLSLIEYAEAYSDTEFGPIQSPVRGLFPITKPPHVRNLTAEVLRLADSSGLMKTFIRLKFTLVLANEYKVFVSENDGPFLFYASNFGRAGEVTIFDFPVQVQSVSGQAVKYCFKVIAVSGGMEADFPTAPVVCMRTDDPLFRTPQDKLDAMVLVAQFAAPLANLLRVVIGSVGNLLKNPLFILGLIFWVVLTIYQLFVRPRSNEKTVELARSGASFRPHDPIIAQNVTEGFDENDEIIASAAFAVETRNFPPRANQTGQIQIGFEFYDSNVVSSDGLPTGRKIGEAFGAPFTPPAATWRKERTPKAIAPARTRMVRFVVRAASSGYTLGGRNQFLLMRNPSLEIVEFPDQDDTVHAGFDQLLALNQAQAMSSNIAPANLIDNTDFRHGTQEWFLHPSVSLIDKADGRWLRLSGPVTVDGDPLIWREFTSANIDDNAFIFSTEIELNGPIEQGRLAIALEMYDGQERLIGGDETPIDPQGPGRQWVKAIVPRGTQKIRMVVRRAFANSFGFGSFGETEFGIGDADVLVIPDGTHVDFTRFQFERALPGQETPSAYTPDRTLWDDTERLRAAIDPDGSVISRIGASTGEYIEIGPRGQLFIIGQDGTRRAPQVRVALYTSPFTASHGDVIEFPTLSKREGGPLPTFTYPPIVILRLAQQNPSVDELGAVNITTNGFTVHVVDLVSNNTASKNSFPNEDPVYIYNKDQTTGYQQLFNALVSIGPTPWNITNMDVTVKFTPPSGSGQPSSGTATVRVKVGIWDGATFTPRASQDVSFNWTRGGSEISKLATFSTLNVPDGRTQLWVVAYYFADTADRSGPGATFVKKLASNPHVSGWAFIASGDYTGTHTLGDGRILRINVSSMGAGYVIFDTLSRLTEAPRSAVTKIKVQVAFENQQRIIDFDVYNFSTNSWQTILDNTKTGSVNWETTNIQQYVSSTGDVKTRIRFKAGSSTDIDFYAVTFYVDPALYLGSGQITQIVASNTAGDIPLSNIKMEAQIFELAGQL